jgi:hypothetical protein
LIAINKALSLDPTNEELITQQKEIAIMEKEIQSTKELAVKLQEKSAVASVKEIDELKSLFASFPVENSAVQEELHSSVEKKKSFADIIQRSVQLIPIIQESFQKQPLLNVYFRESECFSLLLQWIKFISSLTTSWSDLFPSLPAETVLSVYISVANKVLDEKRLAKQIFLENKLYSVYKELLLASMSESSLAMQSAIVECFYFLVKDEIHVKTKTLLFSDNKLFGVLSPLVGNVINNQMTGVYSKPSEDNVMKIMNVLQNSSLIFKELFFSAHEHDKNTIKSLDSFLLMNIIYSFGVALHYLTNYPEANLKKECEKATELLIDCFVGFSQWDSIKKFFIDPLPVPSTAADSKPTVISVIVDAIARHSQFSVNGIAVLMNASIDPVTTNSGFTPEQLKEMTEYSKKVKEIITSKKEGVSLALSVLSSVNQEDNPLLTIPYKQRIYENNNLSLVSEVDMIYYTRKVGLLSRLISMPSISQMILSETKSSERKEVKDGKNNQRISYGFDYLQQLCSILFILVRPNHQDNALSAEQENSILHSTPKWVSDLLAHFIRIIAHLFAGNAKTILSNEMLKKVLYEEELLSSILFLLPMPRMDCYEITDQTVTLMPRFPGNALVIGNIIHILLQFFNNEPQLTRLLFEEILSLSKDNNNKKKNSRYYTIEKSICAMATCQDIRVRKNIAILLAKACQIDAKIRERVSYYRGLQMIVELQKEL